jgi:hypothetical protein
MPVPGHTVDATACNFLVEDGIERPWSQLGVPVAAALPDPVVYLPLLRRQRRLLGRLLVVLVKGLFGHLDGRLPLCLRREQPGKHAVVVGPGWGETERERVRVARHDGEIGLLSGKPESEFVGQLAQEFN